MLRLLVLLGCKLRGVGEWPVGGWGKGLVGAEFLRLVVG